MGVKVVLTWSSPFESVSLIMVVGDFVFGIRYHGNRVGTWYIYYVSYLVFESSIIYQIFILTVAFV